MLVGVGLLAAVAVIGMTAGRDSRPDTTVAAVAGNTTEPATTSPLPSTVAPIQRAPGDPGTIESPIPLGRYGEVGDGWNMRVNWIDFDANEAVVAASRLNDPPDPGRSYVVANITVVYKGTSPETARGVTTGYFGTVTGEDVRSGNDPAGFLIAPDPDLPTINDVVPGAQVTGNIAYSVPDADLNALLVVASPYASYFSGQLTYFATSS